MTVKVYIWQPSQTLLDIRSSRLNSLTNRNVGHVSMQVKNNYISHRPWQEQNNYEQITPLRELELIYQTYSSESNINRLEKFIDKDIFKKYMLFDSVSSADSTNYTYEKEVYDRGRVPKHLKIRGINEDKMLDYYNYLKTSKYHPLTNNCCTFIANIIRNSLDCSNKYINLCSFCSKTYIYEPFYSDDKFINFLASIMKVNPYTVNSLSRLISIVQTTRIWTPSLIEQFIDKINNQNLIKKIITNKRYKKICLKNRAYF